MQSREQKNAYNRQHYLLPGVKQKASDKNRRRYLKKHADHGECQPDYGLAFKSAAVQITLTNWGR